MADQIILIERLWIDDIGRNSAWGYEPAGYVLNEDDAKPLLKEVVIGNGFPFQRGHKIAKYRTSKLNLLKPEAQS